MDEKKPMTIEDLAQEMRAGFKLNQQGFEMMNTKIDTVESNFDAKLDVIREGMFTPDEKASILDTVKLVNDHLSDNVTGKDNITFTRKEYDVVTEKVGLPNKFIGGGLKTQVT